MGMTTPASLDTILVLFRAPDTLLGLWGIPYRMRDGQQPGDIWRAHRDYVPPPYGTYGSKAPNISDWIYLGTPGWFGDMTEVRIAEIKAFLARLGDVVPGSPNEWAVVPAAQSVLEICANVWQTGNFWTSEAVAE